MLNTDALIEAILFTFAQATTIKRLAELCGVEVEEVQAGIETLRQRLDECGSGLQLVVHGNEAELVTRPELSELVRQVVKAETQGELSRPSLEALAILAYRGPMTRPELEQIRGVQSSMILRNLMMRGLVEVKEDMRLGQPTYGVTLDFVKYLGVETVDALPDFDALHGSAIVNQVLKELEEKPEEPGKTVAV